MIRERLLKVLLGPHVSEKATIATELNNQYVFKVIPDATKTEVKDAVEALFKVSVTGVNILNVKGKEKRFGRHFGRRKNWKKAYVQLQEGQTIDFLDSVSAS